MHVPPPSPPAPHVVTGHYVIRTYDKNGVLMKMWLTDNYKERSFPRSVTFAADGKSVTLTGSYQISKTNQ